VFFVFSVSFKILGRRKRRTVCFFCPIFFLLNFIILPPVNFSIFLKKNRRQTKTTLHPDNDNDEGKTTLSNFFFIITPTNSILFNNLLSYPHFFSFFLVDHLKLSNQQTSSSRASKIRNKISIFINNEKPRKYYYYKSTLFFNFFVCAE